MPHARLPFEEPSAETVRALLAAMAGRRVLVVGDGMLDGYIYGTSSRLSPEAPVQIVQVDREERLLGGAANVAKCLVALGAKVTLACMIGHDSFGDEFLEEARSLGIDTSLVHRDPLRCTLVKTRVVSGRQHLVRIDREGRGNYAQDVLDALAAAVRRKVADVDAVLLSDYEKGVLTEEVCAAAIESAGERPVLVDPKGLRWKRYAGATIVKPNHKEALAFLATRDAEVATRSAKDDSAECESIADRLRTALPVKNLLLTRSEFGFSLAAEGGCLSLPAKTANIQDEAGAGDVVGATTCLALAAGAPVGVAAWLGNIAAGVKVSKFGTHTVSNHEILEALGEQHPSSERKLLGASQAARMAANLRGAGKKVVFTNGCFDILHLGHVTYLEKARRLGDALIVGINTDASVRRLKGPERPVNTENDRARVISSLGCVDGVVLFGEDTPLELIKAVKPDVLCKGADYQRKEDVVGWDVVEANGGRVALIELVEGRSTSGVINKFKKEAEGLRVVCKVGDITDEHVDVLVSSANVWLNMSGGVNGAILLKGGESVQRELHENLRRTGRSSVEVGSVHRTGPGTLAVKAILHAVGVDLSYQSSIEIVAKTIETSLQMAADLRAETVALTALGTGYGPLSMADFAAALKSALRKKNEPIREIRVVLPTTEHADEFRGAMGL